MSDPRTDLDEVARELAEYRITAVIVDTLGNPVPQGFLTELRLTLYDLATLTVINFADHVNILNNGRGTVDNDGNLIITLLTDDAVMIDSQALEETHIALVEWSYNAGVSTGRQELAFRIRNMSLVP